MTNESLLIVLFIIATGVAMLAQRIRIPYTVALVLAGLGVGALGLFDPPHLTKEVLFAFILPGLLFEASFHLHFDEFRRIWRTIVALAAPGVVVAIALTGLITTVSFRVSGVDPAFSLTLGFVFGGLIAATDPIAVVALFRSMNAPPALTTMLEGESLLNDGTSIVFLTLIVAYVTGIATTPVEIALSLFSMVGGGLLIGSAIGFAISRIMKQVDDPMIVITLTMIAAYGSFVLGEQLHFSGVLATVAAGMICGSYGREVGMSDNSRVAVRAFWDYASFALNSVVFLLIGFTVPLGSLLTAWPEIVIAFAATLIGRAGVVYGVTWFFRRTPERIPSDWRILLTWGGLRGALSIVLALGLAMDFPGRERLLTMTFGVVLVSLIVQGLSMSIVVRRLRAS